MKFLLPFLFLLCGCAVIVHPTGGDQDITAPAARRVSPDSNSIDFKKKDVRILFDEYIELKDANGILISPPPRIKPKTEIVGKSLIIHFKEPLRDGTTYTVQLINAIHDVNEKNVLPFYSLSFSTGNQIDTHFISGSVRSNYTGEPNSGFTVGLFHSNVNDYPDSVVYPLYVSKTRDDGSFTLAAIKDGSYTIYAFNDINSNLRFETGENFAFHPVPVNAGDTVELRSAEHGKALKPLASNPIVRDINSFLLPIKRPEKGTIKLVPLMVRSDKSELLYTYPVHADTLLVVDFIKNPEDTTADYQLMYDSEILDTIQVTFSSKQPDYPIFLENRTVIPSKPLVIKSRQPIRSVRHENIYLLLNDSVYVWSSGTSDAFNIYLTYDGADQGNYTLVFHDSALHYFDNTFSKRDTIRFTTNSRNNFSDLAVLFNNSQNKLYRVELLKKLDAPAEFFVVTTSDSVFFYQVPSGEYHIRLLVVDPVSLPNKVVPFRQMPSPVHVHPAKVNLRGGWTIGDLFINNKED